MIHPICINRLVPKLSIGFNATETNWWNNKEQTILLTGICSTNIFIKYTFTYPLSQFFTKALYNIQTPKMLFKFLSKIYNSMWHWFLQFQNLLSGTLFYKEVGYNKTLLQQSNFHGPKVLINPILTGLFESKFLLRGGGGVQFDPPSDIADRRNILHGYVDTCKRVLLQKKNCRKRFLYYIIITYAN